MIDKLVSIDMRLQTMKANVSSASKCMVGNINYL